MFGYIKPVQPELKVKEYEAYKGVYCGLCKQMGRVYGPFVRFTLSYDFVFLALLAIGVQEEPIGFSQERCMAHPLKKRPVCQENAGLDLAACAAVILLYHKLKDNWQDGGWKDKAVCLSAMPFAFFSYRRAIKKLPDWALLVQSAMEQQQKIERSKCGSADRASEPTAKILESLLESLSDDPIRKPALKRMGYLLGRWVYLIDALDDLKEDIEKDCYNPFRYQNTETVSLSSLQEEAVASLYLTTAEIIRAYELLDIRGMGQLLDNIVMMGLKQSIQRVQEKRFPRDSVEDSA